MIHWRRRPRVPAGMRVYLLDGVGGRLDVLERALAGIHADHAARPPSAARLVMLGGLVDGPDAAPVVLRAMRLGSSGDAAVLCGPAELALLRGLDGEQEALDWWLGQGGASAMGGWGVGPARQAEADAADRLALVRSAVPAAVHHWLMRRPARGRIGDYHLMEGRARARGLALPHGIVGLEGAARWRVDPDAAVSGRSARRPHDRIG